MEPSRNTDDLKDAPQLRGISKSDPFVVPDGFFDQFPHVVQARVVEEGRKRTKPELRWSPIWVPLVALVVLSIGVFWWTRPVQVDQLADSITVDENTDLAILENVDNDQLYALWENDAPMGTVDLPVGTDDLFAYLENEDLSLELLIE